MGTSRVCCPMLTVAVDTIRASDNPKRYRPHERRTRIMENSEGVYIHLSGYSRFDAKCATDLTRSLSSKLWVRPRKGECAIGRNLHAVCVRNPVTRLIQNKKGLAIACIFRLGMMENRKLILFDDVPDSGLVGMAGLLRG